MNYIYDIVVNFNEILYDFYEWKKSDNVINIRKIPLFRVNDDDYLLLKYNKIKLDKEFILKIENLTSSYTKSNIGIACLISNTKESIALLFNKEGDIIKRSSLLFDEEEEVNNEAESIQITKINYLKNEKKIDDNISRIEREKRYYLNKYIKKLDLNEDSIKIKYLYYDYFDSEEEDIKKAKDKIIGELENVWSNKLDKLYELVKLLKIKN